MLSFHCIGVDIYCCIWIGFSVKGKATLRISEDINLHRLNHQSLHRWLLLFNITHVVKQFESSVFIFFFLCSNPFPILPPSFWFYFRPSLVPVLSVSPTHALLSELWCCASLPLTSRQHVFVKETWWQGVQRLLTLWRRQLPWPGSTLTQTEWQSCGVTQSYTCRRTSPEMYQSNVLHSQMCRIVRMVQRE